jgi:hypothetical protein
MHIEGYHIGSLMDDALYYLLKWDLKVRAYDPFILFNLNPILFVICSTCRISSQFLSVNFQL